MAGTAVGGGSMFIDWNDNGEFDIFDLGVTLAILEDEDDDKKDDE